MTTIFVLAMQNKMYYRKGNAVISSLLFKGMKCRDITYDLDSISYLIPPES